VRASAERRGDDAGAALWENPAMLRAASSPTGPRRHLVVAVAGLVAAVVVAVAAPAVADEAPPPGPCDFAKLGDACETDDGDDGLCVKHTCSRLSYAGDEPESVDYECMRCAAKKEAKADAAPESGADATDSDIPPKKGCAIDARGLGSSGVAGLFAVLLAGAARRRR
jgi:hypothetical protein